MLPMRFGLWSVKVWTVVSEMWTMVHEVWTVVHDE